TLLEQQRNAGGKERLADEQPAAPSDLDYDRPGHAFLGRRWRCGAGGDNTGPKSSVPPAASGGGGAGLCPVQLPPAREAWVRAGGNGGWSSRSPRRRATVPPRARSARADRTATRARRTRSSGGSAA